MSNNSFSSEVSPFEVFDQSNRLKHSTKTKSKTNNRRLRDDSLQDQSLRYHRLRYKSHLPKNIERLDELILEAAETERRLPSAIRKQKLASWPEYQQAWTSYASTSFSPKLDKANAGQVTRFEMILDSLIDFCDFDDRKLIWAVAHSSAFRLRGANWMQLSKLYRCDRRTVKRLYFDALYRLYYKL